MRLNLPRDHKLGVGIDRLDYTKGIIERFNAVARLLELHPEWVGKFTFVQIAAPTRGTIGDYQDYAQRVHRLAEEINARLRGRHRIRRSCCCAEHHEQDAVYEHHRAADLCFVSSLHDGMNLVAKEFVAAHDDERGVLILSQFAGASRELPEALIVNPYDADQCASALQRRADHAGGRTARPHAADAQHHSRIQRLSLGGPHVARCGGDAAAQALRRPGRDAGLSACLILMQ